MIIETRINAWLQKLTDATSLARSDAAIKSSLSSLVQQLGFERYAFLNVQHKAILAFSNYADSWQSLYFERNFAEIDPVVRTARRELRPFVWHAPHPRRERSKAVRLFYAAADEFGIRSGITIPIRTAFQHVSMLTMASSKRTMSVDQDIDPVAAATAVAFLHARIESAGAATPSSTTALTPRQAACLKWAAEGKTMRDIAELENLSYGTVSFHLNNARKTLDAITLQQATALATQLKLI